MSKTHESKLAFFYRVIAPKMTSVGAAIVIIGALFKIMHWKGAGEALTVGLLVEAFLFFLGAFQPSPPVEVHLDWTKAYPELAHGAEPMPAKKIDTAKKPETPSPTMGVGAIAAIDKLLGDGSKGSAFDEFGKGMQSFNTSVSQMKDVSNSVLASEEYAKTTKQATQSLATLNQAYSKTAVAMTEMATATSAVGAQEYQGQIQKIAKNLGALNAIYEMELKDANSHLKAMNKFYSNLASAMENMADASKESEAFKSEMGKLTTNLTNLNKIYGNMLSAMKG